MKEEGGRMKENPGAEAGERAPVSSCFTPHPSSFILAMRLLPLLLALFAPVVLLADDWKPEPGFISLFNGKDLTGWHYKDEPANILDGKNDATDGRYSGKDGILTVHPHDAAKGPRIRQLWTVQEFPKDFILRLEFRAAYNADSGIFLRKPQLQCRDYPVAGPYKNLTKYKNGDWNTIEVVVKGNVARCTCNGEVLEEAYKLPDTGPIGLEADRDQMEYRHIEIKEVPGGN
jgi:hypothetical protein